MLDREYVTALDIEKGIIKLIDPSGEIRFFRQRGIKTLNPTSIASEIALGKLHKDWDKVPELPKNWSISFEDEEIMGKAVATYSLVLARNRLKYHNKYSK